MFARVITIAALFGAAALVAFQGPARGAVVTVGGSAQDLQDAFSDVENGDEIRIQPGVYTASEVSGGLSVIDRSDLVIRALGKVEIRGSSAGRSLLLDACSNVSIEGIRFTHDGEPGPNSVAVGVQNSEGVSILRCRFTGGSAGVRSSNTTALLVEDSRFDGMEDAIAPLDGSTSDLDFKVNRVRMKNVTGTGVLANSRFSVVEFCNIRMAPGAAGAVRILDIGDRIDGVIVKFNRIKGGVDGVQVAGNDHETFDNTIKKCERHGVAVESGTGAYVARNKVKRCGGAGVSVDTAGNIVEDNKIGKSGLFDLLSTVGEGSNTYSGNKFRTSQFGM